MMTKAEAQAYKERWTLVNEITLNELKLMTPSERYRQFVKLFQFARFMNWQSQLSTEDEIAHSRWQRLKEIWDARS